MSENDAPGTNPEPDFDDPSYADIRALLAEARVSAPMPADLAASLDETLADLVAQRAQESGARTPGTATVLPLPRRARASRFLVAASTAVLLGAGVVGVTAMLQHSGSDSDRAATADTAVAGDAPAAPEAAGARDDAADAPEALVERLNGFSSTSGAGALPQFSAQRFDAQVAAFVGAELYDLGATRFPTAGEAPGAGDPGDDPGSPDSGGGVAADKDDQDAATKADRSRVLSRYAANAGCPGPGVTDGSTVIRIRYAGQPATLVVRPAADGARQVEAWSCDGGRRLATTTVPAS